METEVKKISRPRIDDNTFVKAWVEAYNQNGTIDDVAKCIGCSLAGAVSKWKRLAKEGVELPELKRKNKISNSDKDELNSYIKTNLNR